MNKQLVQLGFITKTHGFKGDLILRLSNFHTSVLKDFSWIFILLHNEEVPFRVKEYQILDLYSILIHLVDIDDESKAKDFIGNPFLFTSDSISLSHIIDVPFNEFIGWKIYDNLRDLGEVTDVIENKTQFLLQIESNDGEILIPFVEEFIIKLDERNKKIFLNLPEGLVDL